MFNKSKAQSRKFFLPWDGPYKVLERTSEVNYKIAKPNQPAKWRIVHYNLLKPFNAEEQEVTSKRPSPLRAGRQEDYLTDQDTGACSHEEQPLADEGGFGGNIAPRRHTFRGLPMSRIPPPTWLDQSQDDRTLQQQFEEPEPAGAMPATDDNSTPGTQLPYDGEAPEEVNETKYESTVEIPTEVTVIVPANGTDEALMPVPNSPIVDPPSGGDRTSTPRTASERGR